MRWWVQLLPFFIVSWLIRRHCEKCQNGRIVYSQAIIGGRWVLIEADRE